VEDLEENHINSSLSDHQINPALQLPYLHASLLINNLPNGSIPSSFTRSFSSLDCLLNPRLLNFAQGEASVPGTVHPAGVR